ncbi:alcohol oxidase [Marasmius fiardii PR-910]|nr:alcohol oxidase [Marasmius fiardii PR-910]
MPLATFDQVQGQSFDYIVVGGGTAGLVVASRLSEDPGVSVLVLEGGNPNLDEPLISRPAQFGFQFNNPQFDWEYKTTPQELAREKQFPWNRGKSLGGSSAMNFSAWTLPPKQDIDDWERLGNKGWNWENLSKYHDKAVKYVPLETDQSLDPEIRESMKIWDLKHHSPGTGPLVITHPRTYLDIDAKAAKAFLGAGVPRSPAPYHGEPKGFYRMLNNVDPKTHLRTYATNAYFTPISARGNLLVLPTAYAHSLVTDGEGDGNIVATGVRFSYGKDKSAHVVHAKKEVILSAGGLKSSQILELSGIGREDVLSRIGVPVKVSLPGVGENIQEHMFITVAFELKDSAAETLDILRDEKEIVKQVELLSKGLGLYTTGLTNIAWLPLSEVTPRSDRLFEEEKKQIEEDIRNNKYPPGLIEQYRIQLERVQNGIPSSEFASLAGFLSMAKPPLPNKRYFTLFSLLNYGFSRGTIHASSKDPFADPEMDPHYFEHEIDRQTLVAGIKFARRIAQTAPLRDEIAVEYSPGPEIQTDQQLTEWVHKGMSTTFHTAGACSMLPREHHGVVDNHLKVYGTRNIRVVDLSIVPLHFASHPQATIYAMAEQASDIIRGRFHF